MPKAAKRHGEKQIDVCPNRTFSVAAQRNVKVFSEKARKAHVPSSPKVGKRTSGIWPVEVDRQPISEQCGGAECYGRVPGKVRENLGAEGEQQQKRVVPS